VISYLTKIADQKGFYSDRNFFTLPRLKNCCTVFVEVQLATVPACSASSLMVGRFSYGNKISRIATVVARLQHASPMHLLAKKPGDEQGKPAL